MLPLPPGPENTSVSKYGCELLRRPRFGLRTPACVSGGAQARRMSELSTRVADARAPPGGASEAAARVTRRGVWRVRVGETGRGRVAPGRRLARAWLTEEVGLIDYGHAPPTRHSEAVCRQGGRRQPPAPPWPRLCFTATKKKKIVFCKNGPHRAWPMRSHFVGPAREWTRHAGDDDDERSAGCERQARAKAARAQAARDAPAAACRCCSAAAPCCCCAAAHPAARRGAQGARC